MFCENCGKEVSSYQYYCANCGHGTGSEHTTRQITSVSSYLPQAILATLFCCMPFGIVAIVYAANVQSRASIGDYEGARINSDKAKMWCWVSFWLGAVPGILYLLWVMFVVVLGAVGC